MKMPLTEENIEEMLVNINNVQQLQDQCFENLNGIDDNNTKKDRYCVNVNEDSDSIKLMKKLKKQAKKIQRLESFFEKLKLHKLLPTLTEFAKSIAARADVLVPSRKVLFSRPRSAMEYYNFSTATSDKESRNNKELFRIPKKLSTKLTFILGEQTPSILIDDSHFRSWYHLYPQALLCEKETRRLLPLGGSEFSSSSSTDVTVESESESKSSESDQCATLTASLTKWRMFFEKDYLHREKDLVQKRKFVPMRTTEEEGLRKSLVPMRTCKEGVTEEEGLRNLRINNIKGENYNNNIKGGLRKPGPGGVSDTNLRAVLKSTSAIDRPIFDSGAAEELRNAKYVDQTILQVLIPHAQSLKQKNFESNKPPERISTEKIRKLRNRQHVIFYSGDTTLKSIWNDISSNKPMYDKVLEKWRNSKSSKSQGNTRRDGNNNDNQPIPSILDTILSSLPANWSGKGCDYEDCFKMTTPMDFRSIATEWVKDELLGTTFIGEIRRIYRRRNLGKNSGGTDFVSGECHDKV